MIICPLCVQRIPTGGGRPMSDLWNDAYDLRLGLRCMQSVVYAHPEKYAEYERIISLLRQSRRERRRFLTKLRADLFYRLTRMIAKGHK